MNVLHNITALFRSPDAAVLASQAVQGADLAARQGAATLRKDAERAQEQVQAGDEAALSAAVAERRERDAPARRAAARRSPGGGEAQPVHERRRIDITA